MTTRDRYVLAAGLAAMLAIVGVTLLLSLPWYAPFIGLAALWLVLMYVQRGRRQAQSDLAA